MPNFFSRCSFSLLALALFLSGCATGANSGTSPDNTVAPGTPVPLEGTKWRLPFGEEGIDGRVVEIKRRPDGAYQALLVDIGRKLTGKVGAYNGWVHMEFADTGVPNSYRGLYRLPGQTPEEATFSVSPDGRVLKCSIENGAWERTE